MADKNIQMTQRNQANNGWDNLFPITKAENVMTTDGTKVTSYDFVMVIITTASGVSDTVVPYPNGGVRGNCFLLGGYITKSNNVFNAVPNSAEIAVYYNSGGVTISVASSGLQGREARLIFAVAK